MDFTLSPEQLLIKDGVARFVADYKPGAGDPWPKFAELGWLAIGSPEDLGGFGGPLETLLVMEQLGRGLVVAPYVAQAVFAGTILRAAGRSDLLERLISGEERFAVAYEEPGARYDPSVLTTIATREGDALFLNGSKARVLDASTANTAIVSAWIENQMALIAVPLDHPNVVRTPFAGEDGHDAATLRFDGARAGSENLIGAPGEGLALLELGLDHAAGALCAEAVGLMSVMHEVTLEYLKQRTQFGVPIGSFQALQHRMAEAFIELELGRSMAYLAAMTLSAGDDARARRRGVSAAKYQIARSGRFVGQTAIQLHGAIAMTEEYKIGHYFKRMSLVERLLGDAGYHLARYRAADSASEPVPQRGYALT